MIAASAFLADGGSCFATTVKMYDAAWAGVMFAYTGPDWRPRDCTASRPRSASALVSGCQPVLTDVAVPPGVALTLAGDGASTRAYQYQTPARMARTIIKQPRRRKKPFIVPERGG